MDLGSFLLLVLRTVVVIAFTLVVVLALTYLERKALARLQQRMGPMRVGFQGILQAPADMFKLLVKEDLMPAGADKWVFRAAAYVAVIPIFLMFVTIPFAPDWVVQNLDLGLFYIIAVSSLSSIGFIMAGLSSASKYPLLGALRMGAQVVSYELPLVVVLLGVAMLAQSLDVREIVAQQAGLPYLVLQPLGFLIFLIAMLAEVSRSPFDIAVAESEVVGGPLAEYSGVRWAMFFLSEYANTFAIGVLAALFFLGGWNGPLLPPVLWLMIKSGVMIFLIFWLRATLPRYRIDQLMGLAWKTLLPLAFANLIVTASALVYGAPGLLISAALALAIAVPVYGWHRRLPLAGVALGLATTFRTMFRKPVTVQYPSEHMPVSARFHGPPGLIWDSAVGEPVCTGCQICARECPCECISVTMQDNPKFAAGESKRRKIVDWYAIDLGLCSYCDICVEVCPFDALVMTPHYETAVYERAGFIANKEKLIALTTVLEPAVLQLAMASQNINPFKEEERPSRAAPSRDPKPAPEA